MKYLLQIISLVCTLLFTANFASASLVDHSFRPFVNNPEITDVKALAVQPDGKYLVGGMFHFASGYVRDGLARFNADGTLDTSFNPQVKGYVTDFIVLADGKILVSGASIEPIQGITLNRRGLFRLHTDGSIDMSFTSGPGVHGVKSIALQADGKVVVGGAFSWADTHDCYGVARFNTDGSVDRTFSPMPAGGWTNAVAVLPDGDIMFGGEFAQVNGQMRQRLARLNPDGSLDPAVMNTDGTILTLTVQPDGKVLVGGRIDWAMGFNRDDVFRVNADGTLDQGFYYDNEEYFGQTDTITVQPDGKVLIGGIYNHRLLNNSYRNLIRLLPNGAVDPTFSIQTARQGTLATAVLPGGEILVGGFRDGEAGGSPSRSFLAKLSAGGARDPNFLPTVSKYAFISPIAALANDKLYIGGSFQEVNGIDRRRIARLNRDGTLDTSFAPAGTNGMVFDLAAQPDGKVIIGGDFGLVNRFSRLRIARLNYDGSVDEDFQVGAGFDSTINRIVLQPDGKILVGGIFHNYNNITRHRIARLNADGTLDTSFDIGSQGPSNAITDMVPLPDGKTLMSGIFTQINGSFVGSIMRLNQNGTRDMTFNPGGAGTGPLEMNRTVDAMIVQPDGKILIGGTFLTYNGVARGCLARLNADGTLDPTFNASTQSVYAMLRQPDGKIVIGGDFMSVNGVPQNKIARLNPDGSLDTTFDAGGGANDDVFELTAQSNGSIVVGGKFNRFGGQDHLSLARLGPTPASLLITPFDFDGDRKTDVSIFRPNSGEWWLNRSSTLQTVAAQFGAGTDKLVPGDYTGDGKTDIAVYRPSSGEWLILRSENGSFFSFPFGIAEDIPSPADYDGDGITDAAVFRPSSATWFILKSNGTGTIIAQFGASGDVPVAADYDGDNRADIAIYRPSNGQWWLLRSTQGVIATTFGISTDKPVQGDYTGDGKADIAFFRPSSGEWFILRSEDSSFFSVPFGTVGDIPSPGDYDGDGKFDTAVFRSNGSTWFVNRTTAGLMILNFGAVGDTPVPSSFVP